MISALDTNVLLDIFTGETGYLEASLRLVRLASRQGGLVICEIVFAEISGGFDSREELEATLSKLAVRTEPIGLAGAFLAGQAFRHYRRRGVKRERILADFLIGAHAQTRSSRLITRDRGFYRQYFSELEILDPTDAKFA